MRGGNQHGTRQLAQIQRDFAQVKERVDVLVGDRGDRGAAAVRRKDLAWRGDIEPMQAAPVSIPPTEDDFNALVSDVKAIRDQLERLAVVLARLSR